jgi:dihydroorotate dehydrogenase
MAKADLFLSGPLLNAAGMLGFAPDMHAGLEWTQFGAFVTNPISREARSPASGSRCRSYPGGFLLHTGYPNPGFRAALKKYRPRWERASLPILVHLLAGTARDLRWMAEQLEGVEGVMGIEVGLPPGISPAETADLVAAAAVELPVVARLPFEGMLALAAAAASAGAAAVSLAPPRGAVPGDAGELLAGRLYGPGVFPQALAAVRTLAIQGHTVIGAGGVYSRLQAEAMLKAGASAVQLDGVLWRGGFFS